MQLAPKVSLRALYKDPLYLLYSPSVMFMCEKTGVHVKERTEKKGEKKKSDGRRGSDS